MNFHRNFLSTLLTIAFLFVIQGASFAKKSPENWELIDSSQGIDMYERWIENNNHEKVRERKGNMRFEASLNDVLAIISDSEKVSLWMSNVEKVEVLKQIDHKEWYMYTLLDVPWPFSKQDMVSRYTVNMLSENKVEVLVHHQDGIYPVQDGVERLNTFNAIWSIETHANNMVEVSFTTKSTAPPKYPTWMQDPVIRSIFLSNLEKFKALVLNA